MHASVRGSAEPGAGGLGVVTVVFDPPAGCLERQAAALPDGVLWVLVDNGPGPGGRSRLHALASSRPGTVVLGGGANIGLAAALNRGVARIAEGREGCDMVLLLDQDSEPQEGSIRALMDAFRKIEAAGPVGCVGPSLIDTTTGLRHGFHCIRGWRWARIFPADDAAPVECANINGSGTLMPMDACRRLGGFDESLFVDHVDTEWSFRMRHAGYRLFGVPAAKFRHAMGERGIRFWLFGWRVWPQRAPARHYYVFRNAVMLLRRAYVPRVWKGWCIVKLALTIATHAAFDPRRGGQVSCMLKGALDGCRLPSGNALAPPGGKVVR